MVGGLVASRRPKHLVGWVPLGIGAGFLLANVASSGASEAHLHAQHPSLLGQVSLVTGAPLAAITFAMVGLLLALFPTGTVTAG